MVDRILGIFLVKLGLNLVNLSLNLGHYLKGLIGFYFTRIN